MHLYSQIVIRLHNNRRILKQNYKKKKLERQTFTNKSIDSQQVALQKLK